MFCEKCGNQLHEGDAFCEKCGAPVAQAPAQPEQAPVQQPTVEQPAPQADPQPEGSAQPVDNTAQQVYNNAQPGYNPQPTYGAQAYQNAPVQPKEKKPFPKKLAIKLGIICGAAAVVIVGVIVALSVIIPNLNKLEVEDYIDVTLDENYLYNGYARATVVIDKTSIEIDRLTDGDSESSSSLEDYDLSDYVDALSDYSKYYTASEAIDDILDYVTINAYEKEAGESTAVSNTNDSYVQITDLDKDDVIVVEIKWDKSDSAKKSISKLEGEAGFKFDQTDVTTEIKVSDVLDQKNLELKEVQNVDIVSYMKENNLVKTLGVKDGEYKVQIDSFTYTTGNGYTISYDNTSYSYGVKITDEYQNEIDTIYFEISKDYDLSAGQKFTVSTSQQLLEEASILVAETTEEFTVTENTVMTADEAKANIDKLTAAAGEYIDEDVTRFTDYSPAEIYYVTPKSSSSDAQAYVLVVEKGKYKSYFSSYDSYYYGISIQNPYLIGDEMYTDGTYYSSSAEKLADYKKYDSFLSSDDYTCTKIN